MLRPKSKAVCQTRRFILLDPPLRRRLFAVLGYLLLATVPAAKAYSQTAVINEALASNATGITDEDGDFSDWIELYNAGDQPLDLRDFALSDDAREPRQWIFPPVALAPHGHLLIFASGKDRRDAPAFWQTLLDQGDLWRYTPGTNEPPSGWQSPAFDDSRWLEGASGFGYGDGDDATTVAPTLSLYLRRTLAIPSKADVSDLLLYIDYDDGFVAYLNGVEIARANLGQPGEFIAHNRGADSVVEPRIVYGGLPMQIRVASELLRDGANVLAIQVHNHNIDSSDLTLIQFLLAGYQTAPATPRPVPSLLQPTLPRLHTNFRISSGGEKLLLVNAAGETIDDLQVPALRSDLSFGRHPDGAAELYVFSAPTPGKTNNGSTAYRGIMPAATFSQAGGFYGGPQQITMSKPFAEAELYYTVDGSEPSRQSMPYTGAIDVTQTTVLRARAFADGYLLGNATTATYFIGENLTLPVVSLAATPGSFWDNDSGIYVAGPNASPQFPHFGANFWQDWERAGHVELFEAGGVPGFSQDMGVKIFGGWSRGFPQKSLSFFARARYGTSSLDYALFPTKNIRSFEAFVLRNSGNDWTSTMLRDGALQSLVAGMNIDYLAYRPAVLYINGAYWGIQNLREKINEHYVAGNHGLDADQIDLLENNAAILEGDNRDYLALLAYIQANDLTNDAHYQQIAAQIDIDSYLDYLVAQIYFDNTDWPGNNVKFWRSRQPETRWRWILFDTDFGFGLFDSNAHQHNTLAFALASNGPDWPNPPWSTLLFRHLIKNRAFRDALINRMADHLNTTFAGDRVVAVINSLANSISAELPRHRQRWPQSAPNWQRDLQAMKNFATLRPAFVRAHVLNQFRLDGTMAVHLNAEPAQAGRIRVNSQPVSQFPWDGQYFRGVPVTLTAMPAAGYRFAGWSDSTLGLSPTVTLPASGDLRLTAHFAPTSASAGSAVINEINYNSADDFDTEDWVEFYNPGDTAFDLSGWMFKDEDDDHIFTFAAGTELPAQGYLVLCADTTMFKQLQPDVKNFIGNMDFGFAGSGELLRLFNPDGQLIDSVVYDDTAPWPVEPDGNGYTLELLDAGLDNSLAENWRASRIIGGTPGRQNTVTTPVQGRDGLPANFILYQNYPNPFNPATTIRYALPEPAHVTITVYNVLGQRLAVLLDAPQAPGEHRIGWDIEAHFQQTSSVRQLASGVFFYRIEIKGGTISQTETRKMLYVR